MVDKFSYSRMQKKAYDSGAMRWSWEYQIDKKAMHGLGTPEDLKAFLRV